MSKMKLAVAFGGPSSEYEISLLSGAAIIREAKKLEKYQLVPLGISKRGDFYLVDSQLEEIESDNWQTEAQEVKASDLKEYVDFVFPALHGPYGEDGTFQGLMEALDIPYAGCGVAASAVAMDKGLAKELFAARGLPQTKHFLIEEETFKEKKEESLLEIDKYLKLPYFVKPANLGSSVGISKVKEAKDLEKAMGIAFKYDRRIIVEEGIDAREVETSVIGNNNMDYEVSAIGEIIPSKEFYDYSAKYQSEGGSKLLIPAELTDLEREKIENLAIEAFSAIGGTGFGRIDFFIDRVTNTIYLNEINSIPGFTKYSMMPLLWKERGLSFPELLDRIVGYGYERYNAKNHRKTKLHW